MDKENNLCEPSRVDTFPLKKTSTEFTNDSVSQLKAHSSQGKEDGGKASMDSFVTVRPPRGRRHSQPVAIYNPATVDKDNHPSEMTSTHRHRSSSQPRPYQSVEAFPPQQREHSVRSTSQPRSTQNSHFLESFNVADCHDVRNIPDPPTPSPGISRRRHRRRVSSSVLKPMSSMDVNNRGNNQTITYDHEGELKPAFVTRRKRKTMSHVPAPLNPAEESGFAISTDPQLNEERCDVEARSDREQINLSHGDEGEDRIPKRKKKRQSMVIPRDLPLEASLSDNGSVNEISRESNVARNSPSKPKKQFVPLDFKNMQRLRSLVRGYCAQTTQSEQASDDAKEILDMTGYPLPRKRTDTSDNNKSAVMLADRRAVIQKIAPVLSQLEARKKQDVKMWENKTQCRVTKSEKSSKYKYHDIHTNKKVGSQEYKRRYIAVLEHERPYRLSRARQWMDELDHNPDIYCSTEEQEQFAYTNPVNMNHQEQNELDIIEMRQKEAFIPPRDMNIVRDRPPRGREAVPNEVDQIHEDRQSEFLSNATDISEDIAVITEASSEDTDDKSRESSFSPKTESSDFVDDDITEGIPLLPLPSKDSETMDPEIKAAEKRLWAKIDQALHEYSGEVMMIQRKKRRLAKADPVAM